MDPNCSEPSNIKIVQIESLTKLTKQNPSLKYVSSPVMSVICYGGQSAKNKLKV